MDQQIRPWMYKVASETPALIFCILLLLLISYIFSLFNLYALIGLVVIGLIYVRLNQAQYIGNAIKVHNYQFADLYDIFKNQAKRLNISKAGLYIKQDPEMNAFALGITRCSIVLTSALVEQMNQKELSFVIGHELGHFKAKHTIISTLINPLGTGNVFSSLIFGLWQRQTELSADRCGLILVKDIDVAISSMVKLSVGGKLYSQINMQGYISQISKSNDATVKLSEILLDHPLTTTRIRKLYIYWKEHFISKT